jgi:hypothetical protein
MIRCIAVCVTVLSLTIAADAASSQTPPSSAYALLVGPVVNKQSQKCALTKPMLKVCTAKRENHFEPSVRGTLESPLSGHVLTEGLCPDARFAVANP